MAGNDRKLSLPELKQTESRILSFFADFCKEHQIRYFLCNGTLLGSVKYNGFIPWDDDIDVCLLREDYDRFIQTFSDTDEFVLNEFSRNEAFLYPFAKLSMKHTKLVELGNENGIDLGINIDIFPIDKAGNHAFFAKTTALYGRLLAASLQEAKIKEKGSKRPFSVTLLASRCICTLFSPKQIIKKIIKNAKKHKKGRYVGCLAWPAYKEREIVSHTVFGETEPGMFEGKAYVIPSGYDEYLRSLYGDYRLNPPKEKQKTHHTIEAYILDDE